MQTCNGCGMLKIYSKSKCACTVKKPFDVKKLSKKTKEEKKPKAIKQVSEKKKERIKATGWEFKLFQKIAKKRQIDWVVVCENKKCNKPMSLEVLTVWNFDHDKPKSKWENYRLDENNIKILCFACHFEKTNCQKLKVNYKN